MNQPKTIYTIAGKDVLMPRCPKCGAKITYLHYSGYERREGRLNKKGQYSHLISTDVLTDSIEYRCPKCDFLIAESEDDAVRFLKGQGSIDESIPFTTS